MATRILKIQPTFQFYRYCLLNCLKPHTSKSLPSNFDATKYRTWINLDLKKDSNTSFSVLSYNILSQHYMWKQVFGYLNMDYLDWENYRFPLINESIKQFNCDIMCFQELESNIYQKKWMEHFPLNGGKYESFYVRKPPPNYWGDYPIECMDGIAIFINTNRFTILKHRSINYSKFISENPRHFEMTNDLRERVLLRNTVGIIVELYDKLTKKTIYVSNTHLYWSPLFNDVKVIQTKVLLMNLQSFINLDNKPSPKILMCGDFNSTPNSDVYRLLETGGITPKNSDSFKDKDYGRQFNQSIDSPFSLSAAYKTIMESGNVNGHHLGFTSFTKSLTEVLDHIWYSKENLKVHKILSEVDKEYCSRDDVQGFPNKQFPSDHIPLIANIEYL